MFCSIYLITIVGVNYSWNVGVARGCGWQKIGAFVNLGTYYIVGIPTAVVLAFALHFGGKVVFLIPLLIFTFYL